MKDAIKKKFVQFAGKTGTVTEVEPLSPRVRRIRIQSKSLIGITFVPGDKIKLQAGEALRSYTPSRFDAQEGWLDIIVFLHGQGPAAKWVSTVKLGTKAPFFGPVRSVKPVTAPFSSAGFVGDETTIGLALALTEAHPEISWQGAIECDPEDQAAVRAAGLHLNAVRRGELSAFVQEAPSVEQWWMSGEADTVVEVRARLLDRGVPKTGLSAKAYWSKRGTAHRKNIERTMLHAK